MNEEVKELLDKLGNMEDAPLIWINRKVENLLEENKQLKADLEMYENGVYFSSENDKLQNEIDNLNHIIDKQDKDITILSKGNKHLKEVIDKAIDLIEKSGTTDIGIDSNNNIIHYHQLTEDETGELLDILKGVNND